MSEVILKIMYICVFGVVIVGCSGINNRETSNHKNIDTTIAQQNAEPPATEDKWDGASWDNNSWE